jgi:RimJ/RimL family protein N-acetyltransferase
MKQRHSLPYLFTSTRLGFRNWKVEDLDAMSAINADPEVMEFFPRPATRDETKAFIERMQDQFSQNQYCYFAVEKLADSELIGFIGLMEQTYPAEFTPCVDIGWRLKRSVWNQGYATEGAKRCLEYAFNTLGLDQIFSTAPEVNLKSQHIMLNMGMQKVGEFIHPRLAGDKRLEKCVLYNIHKIR